MKALRPRRRAYASAAAAAAAAVVSTIALAGGASAVTTPGRAGPGPYRLTPLASPGGAAAGNSINDTGWIAGTASPAGNATTEAALWRGAG